MSNIQPNPQVETNGLADDPALEAKIRDWFYSSKPQNKLPEMVCSEYLLQQIRDILQENRDRAKLLCHDLKPRRILLLAGPAGTGKTLAARIFAGEMHMDLHIVANAAILKNGADGAAEALSGIFKLIPSKTAVYLFENMWLPDNRGMLDLPGLQAVFMQLLAMDDSQSIILVESTESAEHLGWRIVNQFDDELVFGHPAPDQIKSCLANSLALYNKSMISSSVFAEAAGLSYAKIVRACRNAIKHMLLNNLGEINMQTLKLFLRAESLRSK